MRMVPPEVKAPRVCVARNQPEYKVLTVALVVDPQAANPPNARHNAVLMAFRPTKEERERIFLGGDDIYISLLTFGGPQQPIIVWAGKNEPAAHFGVEVE